MRGGGLGTPVPHGDAGRASCGSHWGCGLRFSLEPGKFLLLTVLQRGGLGKQVVYQIPTPLKDSALYLALLFPTVRLPTVLWLPWPWRSSKLLDTRQEGTERKPTLWLQPAATQARSAPKHVHHPQVYLDLIKSADARTFWLRCSH